MLQNLQKKTENKMKHSINTTIKNNKTKHETTQKEHKNKKQTKTNKKIGKEKNLVRNELELQRKTPNLDLQNEKKEAITSYKQERHEHNNNMKHKGTCTSSVKVTMQSIKRGHNNTKKHKEKTQQ